MPSQISYYVDDFTDERIPCEPTLEAWAAWMSAPPEEDWFGRDLGDALPDGDVYTVSRLELLGTLLVTVGEGGAVRHAEPPPGTEQFVQMDGAGWDAETFADSVGECLGGSRPEGSSLVNHWFPPGSVVEVGCIRSLPDQKYRLDVAAQALILVEDADG